MGRSIAKCLSGTWPFSRRPSDDRASDPGDRYLSKYTLNPQDLGPLDDARFLLAAEQPTPERDDASGLDVERLALAMAMVRTSGARWFKDKAVEHGETKATCLWLKNLPLLHTAAASPWHGSKTEVSQAMAMTGSAGSSRREADARSNLTGAADLPDYADFGMASVAPGTSIFDPVLCELVYRWFSPPGAAVLDPFAGGSVRGVVAERLGRRYTGIDLSARQLASNRLQAEQIGVAPRWIHGDSTLLDEHVADQQFDLVFTCPPYYDLEVYSNDPRDLSAQGSYTEFLDLHARVIARAAEHLRPGRFMVYIVSEVRGKDGHYLGFVPDTISAARTAGLTLYNEAVLINPAGTLPMRVTKQFNSGRKLGRMHQNVLVFAKGRPPVREWGMALDDAPAAVTAAGFFDDLPDLPVPADTLDGWF